MTMQLGMRSAINMINGYVTGRFCKASVPTKVAFAFAAAKKIKRGRTNVCSLLGSPCENLW